MSKHDAKHPADTKPGSNPEADNNAKSRPDKQPIGQGAPGGTSDDDGNSENRQDDSGANRKH